MHQWKKTDKNIRARFHIMVIFSHYFILERMEEGDEVKRRWQRIYLSAFYVVIEKKKRNETFNHFMKQYMMNCNANSNNIILFYISCVNKNKNHGYNMVMH